MRMIRHPRCDICTVAEAVWVLRESTGICERCRLMAMNWMRANDFGFDHVFMDEISGVVRPPIHTRFKGFL